MFKIMLSLRREFRKEIDGLKLCLFIHHQDEFIDCFFLLFFFFLNTIHIH